MSSDNLYFRQLLAGRDFALNHPVAGQLANFIYLIGDRKTQKAVVVDPAWDVGGLLTVARNDGMEIEGVLATHSHPDHIGGDLLGYQVEGISKLLKHEGMKVHIHRAELDHAKRLTGVSDSDLIPHEDGDKLNVGNVEIVFLHTPGHSPGSQCFLVEGRLVSGDTLFVSGCGRVDLPGSDPKEMFLSLTERLAKLPGEVALFPGHDYGDKHTSTMEEERQTNYYLRVPNVENWMRLMG